MCLTRHLLVVYLFSWRGGTFSSRVPWEPQGPYTGDSRSRVSPVGSRCPSELSPSTPWTRQFPFMFVASSPWGVSAFTERWSPGTRRDQVRASHRVGCPRSCSSVLPNFSLLTPCIQHLPIVFDVPSSGASARFHGGVARTRLGCPVTRGDKVRVPLRARVPPVGVTVLLNFPSSSVDTSPSFCVCHSVSSGVTAFRERWCVPTPGSLGTVGSKCQYLADPGSSGRVPPSLRTFHSTSVDTTPSFCVHCVVSKGVPL